MSMTPAYAASPRPAQGGNLAERSLFSRLVDDAAVFPPGLAPLPRAVTEHLARRQEPYADLVGPLLVPASAAAELRDLDRPAALEVGLIGRPGTPVDAVGEAVRLLAGAAGVAVAGVEVGWSTGWQNALAWDLPLSVEVPRDPAAQDEALSGLADAQDESTRLQAKLRTGSTPDQGVPTAAELARFVRGCIDRDLSFKLTGGLHHALPHTTPDGEEQHGLLGVLCATRWALGGAGLDDLEALLTEREPQPLLDLVTRMSDADASVVRAFFTAFGCCGVTDPIHDLSTLGLIKEHV